MNRIEAIEGLALGRKSKHEKLTREEGWAVIDAVRRGVTYARIAEAVGVTRSNLMQHLGLWAVTYVERKGEVK